MKRTLKMLGIGAFWIGVWAMAAALVNLPLLLPGPWDTLKTLCLLMGQGAFWKTIGMTMLRVAFGYGAAVGLGLVLAVLCHGCRAADALLSPVRAVIKATPVSSFIILVLLWMKKGKVPSFISFLMVLPMVWTGVQEALAAMDRQLLEMAQMYRFSPLKTFRYVYIPSIRPSFAAACMTGLGFAWKSGIAAEVIALPAFSVGVHLYNAKIYLESTELFAWTLTVILLSMGLEALLKKCIGRWKGEEQ